MSGHLRPAEVSEWLAGIRGAYAERHLAECADCAAEVARAGEPLVRFGAAARAWTAAQTPVPRLGAIVLAAQRKRRVVKMRAALAAAAAILLVSAPVYRQRERALEARQDEILLQQVQNEISLSAPQPMQPLEKLVAWNPAAELAGSGQ